MDKIPWRDVGSYTLARSIVLGLVLWLGYWVFACYVAPVSAANFYAEIIAEITTSKSSFPYTEAWKPIAPLGKTLLKALNALFIGAGLQSLPSPNFFRLFFFVCLFPVLLQLTRLVRQQKASLLTLLPVMLPLIYSAVADGDFDVLLFSLTLGALTSARNGHPALSGALAGLAGLLSAPAWLGAFGIFVVAKKRSYFLAAFLTVVAAGGVLEWQATGAWINNLMNGGLLWSRFRSDLFSVFAKNLVPVSWSLLFVIPVLSLAFAGGCLWFQRSTWLDCRRFPSLYSLCALILTVLLNGMPGLAPSGGIIALPFIFLAAIHDRRATVALVLFCFALWFDMYGKNEFVQILITNRTVLNNPEEWTMPSYIGVCAMNFIVVLQLWAIVRTPENQIIEATEKIPFELSIQSLIESLRSLPPIPPLRLAPVLAIAALTVLAVVVNMTGLGARHFPITGVSKSANVTVHFPPGAVPEALWIAQVAGTTNFKVSCNGSFVAEKKMGRTNELGWGYLKLPELCRTGSIQVGITFVSFGLVTELLFTDKEHKRVDPTLVCEPACVEASHSLLTDESLQIPGIPFPDFGSILDEMYNSGPGVGKILGMPIETVIDTSHPYLGRWFIYKSMQAFGIGAFSWRFPSALASALLPLLVFFLGRQLLAHNGWALFSAVLVFTDFLRITSGRTAYVDSQTTFWLLLHLIFALKLVRSLLLVEENGYSVKARLRVLALGVACFGGLGAAVSSKWNGLFIAPVSLPLIAVAGYSYLRLHGKVLFLSSVLILCASLMVAVYILPYRPFIKDTSLFPSVVRHTTKIVKVHSTPGRKRSPTHVSSSGVNSWVFANSSYRALVVPFYPGGPLGLYIFGNPIVWWTILTGFYLLIAQQFRKIELRSTLVLMIYAVPVLPWLIISRYTFCYHYLPAATLGTLVVATALRRLSTHRRLIPASAIVLLSLLALWAFAPLIWGIPVAAPRISMLRWFDRWFFEFPTH